MQALRQAFFHEPEVREHARSSRNDHGRDEPIFWHCSKLWITVKIGSAGTARSPCLNSADHLAVPAFWPQALLCCLATLICAYRLPLHELHDNRLLVACKAVMIGSKHGTKEPFNGIAMLYVKLNTSLGATEYVNGTTFYCNGGIGLPVGCYISAINVHARINLNCWHWRCRE